jgi:DNA-binding MarR family transcriptional regulator
LAICVHMHANAIDLPGAGACTCHKVRSLARRLTGIYDAALAAHALTVTQYSALVTLARSKVPVAVAELARRLQMDRTTTSRLVGPLEAAGLLARADGGKGRGDARSRPLQLTAKGRRRLSAAIPAWRAAQRDVDAILGARLRSSLDRAADAANGAFAATAIEPMEIT